MKNNRITTAIVSHLLVLFFALILINIPKNNLFAKADVLVSVESVTCKSIISFTENAEAVYETKPYTDGYARDIKIHFSISGAAYYTVFALAEGESERQGMKIEEVPSDGKVSFSVTDTGIYSVTCRVFDIGENFLAEETVSVKSDFDKPILPTANQMTNWVAQGQTFQAVIDWKNCRDELSGIKGMFYRVEYDDTTKTDWKEMEDKNATGQTSISLVKAGKIVVRCFDRAGNVSESDFLYKKFDNSDPIAPSYTVTPALEQGKYSALYTIRLTFAEDKESGLADKQYYLLNGVSHEVDGDIVLDVKKAYSFVFYALDAVGNRSSYVTLEIPSGYFDTQSPYIDRLRNEIDLRNEKGVCLISFIGDDYKESGINVASVKDTSYFFTKQSMSTYDLYSLRLDCFDSDVYTVEVQDKAGNTTIFVDSVSYFGNEKIVKAVKDLTETYRKADFEQCNASVVEKIENAIIGINNLLNTEGSTTAEILAACENAKKYFQPIATSSYTIESVPSYASTMIRYSVNAEDFDDTSFGNEISLLLNKEEDDGGEYLRLASVEKGFYDCFSLTYLLNGEEGEPLQNGLSITMSLPTGYLDRDFVLLDRKTGVKVDATRVNNSLRFVLTQSTSYALVITGDLAAKTVVPTESVKTIVVFGRTWALSTFLWLVCGTAGGALLVVIALVVVMIVKRR